ncbi:hypothetical protein ACFW2K_39435 [Streptomyces nigra]|uniref:hypothetical protein n=1 Tax=Streptomyces nigra TaxID=1827580 RepID=UPI0036AA1777
MAAGAGSLHPGRTDKRPWLRNVHLVSGPSLVLSGLFIYWSGSRNRRNGPLIPVVFFLVYLATTYFGGRRLPWREILDGVWNRLFVVGVVAGAVANGDVGRRRRGRPSHNGRS